MNRLSFLTRGYGLVIGCALSGFYIPLIGLLLRSRFGQDAFYLSIPLLYVYFLTVTEISRSTKPPVIVTRNAISVVGYLSLLVFLFWGIGRGLI